MVVKSPDTWVNTFSDISNHDEELQAHGKFYTCSYLLDAQDHCYVIHMDKGKVADIAVDPNPLDERYQFALRASADTWRQFSQQTPPPMYHGIWAASFRKDMRLEGDLLVMMQNLRCLTRQLELLRMIGSPV